MGCCASLSVISGTQPTLWMPDVDEVLAAPCCMSGHASGTLFATTTAPPMLYVDFAPHGGSLSCLLRIRRRTPFAYDVRFVELNTASVYEEGVDVLSVSNKELVKIVAAARDLNFFDLQSPTVADLHAIMHQALHHRGPSGFTLRCDA